MSTTSKKAFDLFLISFVSLFLEMAVIRWLPSVFPAFMYFTNLVLIASFLGLGLGCASCHRPADRLWLPVSILVMIFGAAIFRHLGTTYSQNLTDFIFLQNKTQGVPLTLSVPCMFFITFFLFKYIGEILGRAMETFAPLVSYSINISGSICGILTFAFLSFRFAPPQVWFTFGAIGLLWFFVSQRRLAATLFLLGVILVGTLSQGQLWSPYYKLVVQEKTFPAYFDLNVNDHYQQSAIDLSAPTIAKDPQAKTWHDIYNLPYRFLQPERILIVGAGVGNDVIVALQNNVHEIEAVEIDPGTLSIGKTRRPDQPYSHSAVTTFVADARSFMRADHKPYNMIIYGFLDSHALFNNMSGVRLDNFVYTVQGLRRAKALLTDDGAISLSFFVARPWVGERIYFMLKEVFGYPPWVYQNLHVPTELIFIVSNDKQQMTRREIPDFREVSASLDAKPPPPLATDNWPYFYLKNRAIPTDYLSIIAIIMVLSIIIVLFYIPDKRNLVRYSTFFLLGAAFMLIETKSIVQLSLQFGTTWVVNAAVVSGILALILIANFIVIRWKLERPRALYFGLAAALLVSWAIQPDSLSIDNPVMLKTIAVFLAILPLFFAGIVFAMLFRGTRDIPTAFGMNLLGVVLGGCLEYLSLVVGLNHLALLALALYLASWASIRLLPR